MTVSDGCAAEIAGGNDRLWQADQCDHSCRLGLDRFTLHHLLEETCQEWEIRRKDAGRVVMGQAQYRARQRQVGASDIGMAETVDGRLDVLEAHFE